MKLFLCSLAVMHLLSPTGIQYSLEYAEAPAEDSKAPIITIAADETEKSSEENEKEVIPTITVTVGEDFDIKDRITVTDNSDDYRLVCYGEYDSKHSGTYKIKLIAMDKSGNTSSKEVLINVVEEPEPVVYYGENTYTAVYSDPGSLAANGTTTANDAYSIALSLVGMGGQCTTVANAFLAAYYGDATYSNCYAVSAEEARPGDVIYYADGGLGVQHYAIYLGGDSTLHGNWQGSAQIKGVYVNNASAPQFLRPNGH